MLLENGANVDRQVNADGLTPLFVAAQKCQPHMFLKLLSLGANITFTTKTGQGILHAIAANANYEMIVALDFLTKNSTVPLRDVGLNPDLEDRDGMTPLHFCTARKNSDDALPILEWLVKNGGNMDAQTLNEITPLYFTVAFNQTKSMSMLLRQGAGVDIPDLNGITPFWLACKTGNLRAAAVLREHGADVNVRDVIGATPLIAASHSDQEEIVRKLVFDWHANVKLRSCENATAAYVAAHRGNTDVLRIFLKYCDISPNERGPNMTSLLCVAAASGHEATCELLLGYGASVNTKQKDGITPLFAAAQQGHKRVCKLLLEKAADADDNEAGATPLYAAAVDGKMDIVKMLLGVGADVNSRGPMERTVLHHAVIKKDSKLLREFLDLGANPNLIDKNLLSPLLYAAINDDIDIARILLRHGVDTEIGDRNGLTALHTALDKKNFKLAKIIIEAGANPNSVSELGWTPVFIVAVDRNIEILKLLAKKGANFTMVDTLGMTPNDYFVIGDEDKTPLYHVVKEGYLDARGNYLYAHSPPPKTDTTPRCLPDVLGKKVKGMKGEPLNQEKIKDSMEFRELQQELNDMEGVGDINDLVRLQPPER